MKCKTICWHAKEFQNSLEWSITKVYLLGAKLTEIVVIHTQFSAYAGNWN